MRKKITEIADIQLGYQFRRKIEPFPDGTHRVIQIRDFDEDLNLNVEGLSWVRLDKLADKYLVNKGDVLFLSRGHKNWAACVDTKLVNIVTVGHFFVLRPKTDKILPEYLAWYINQAPAQEFVHNIARHGSHMPLVSKSAFAGLKIDVPDLKTQSMIVELSRLFEKEQKLLEKLQKKHSQMINALCLKAIKNKEK
jgi:restriction endonuclease S subunit